MAECKNCGKYFKKLKGSRAKIPKRKDCKNGKGRKSKLNTTELAIPPKPKVLGILPNFI